MNQTPERTKAWFEQLYRETYKHVFGYIKRRVSWGAEDLTAETYLTVWRRRHEVAEITLPWLYAVAANNIKDSHRKTSRQQNLVGKVTQNEPASSLRVADHADSVARNVDAVRDVAKTLAALSEKDAEILRLWTWEYLEPKDIAVVLNISPSAAKARLSRARKRAAEHLQGPQDNVTTLYSA